MNKRKIITFVFLILIIISLAFSLVSCNYKSFKELKYYRNYNSDNITKIYMWVVNGPPREITLTDKEDIEKITNIVDAIEIKRVPYENLLGGTIYLQLYNNETDYHYINIYCNRLTINNKYYDVAGKTQYNLYMLADELFQKYGIEPGYEEPVDY